LTGFITSTDTTKHGIVTSLNLLQLIESFNVSDILAEDAEGEGEQYVGGDIP